MLGPLLFIIYINDKKFADDTKVAYKARSLEDQTIVQDCIDKLVDWSAKWGMEFNTDKCKIMPVGRGTPGFEYKMKDCTLKEVEEERDIGEIIHKDLKPSKQGESAVNQARVVLGQLTRLFHFQDRNVFLRLFIT